MGYEDGMEYNKPLKTSSEAALEREKQLTASSDVEDVDVAESNIESAESNPIEISNETVHVQSEREEEVTSTVGENTTESSTERPENISKKSDSNEDAQNRHNKFLAEDIMVEKSDVEKIEKIAADNGLDLSRTIREKQSRIEALSVNQIEKNKIGLFPVESITANQRQQEKIIAIMETGNLDLLNKQFVNITAEHLNRVLAKIKSGKIGDGDLDNLVSKVGLPEMNTAYENICRDEKTKRGLDSLISPLYYKNAVRRDGWVAPIDSIYRLLQDYPTPGQLQKKLEDDYNKLQEEHAQSDGQRKEGLDMELRYMRQQSGVYNELMNQIYGKRKEYWDQARLLKEESKKATAYTPEAPLLPEIQDISEQELIANGIDPKKTGKFYEYSSFALNNLPNHYPEIGAYGLHTESGAINGRLIWCDGNIAVFETHQGKMKVLFDDLLAPNGKTYGKNRDVPRSGHEILRQRSR